MSILKDIISNEIQTLIGHKPSAEEFKSALDFLDYFWDETLNFNLKMIESLFGEWRSGKCRKCDACGEYFLAEQIEPRIHYQEGEINVCSDKCFLNY